MNEPKSIQGEQQAARAAIHRMDQPDVEKYVDSANPQVVTCRERGRHDFPTIRESGTMHFVDINQYGLHVRRVRCRSCNLVDLVEEWDIRHKGDEVTYAERVSGKPDYSIRGEGGEHYLAKPGHGRMSPKQVRNAVATGQLKGMSFKAIQKETLAERRRNAKES